MDEKCGSGVRVAGQWGAEGVPDPQVWGGGGGAVPKRMWSAVTLKRRCGGTLLSRKNLAIAALAGEVKSPLDQAAGSRSPLARKPGSGRPNTSANRRAYSY
jgi:hypothetical protein